MTGGMSDPRELVDACAARRYVDYEPYGAITPEAFAALRAVLDLHKPRWTKCGSCCDSNGESLPWPCRTVRAITSALEAQ